MLSANKIVVMFQFKLRFVKLVFIAFYLFSRTHSTVSMWRSEDKMQVSALDFYSVGPGELNSA